MPYAVVRPVYVYAPCGPKSLPNVTDHYDNLITLFIIITPVPWENDSKQNDLQAQYSIAGHQSRNRLKTKQTKNSVYITPVPV